MNKYIIGNGVVQDKTDERDFVFKASSAIENLPSWNAGYSVYGALNIPTKLKDQNGSLSCVGQSTAYYGEVLDYIEEKLYKDLSAKNMYSHIRLDGGGAYTRDAVKRMVSVGIPQEELDPSYPATEAHMLEIVDDPDVLENAKIYKSKAYTTIWHMENMDIIRQAIFENHGVLCAFLMTNEGWQSAFVRPPKSGEKIFGHQVFLHGWGMRNGKKYILFRNSWGVNWGQAGDGLIGEDYFLMGGQAFNIWTLQDMNNYLNLNNMTNVQLVKNGENEKGFYVPITTPDALKSMALNYGIPIPLKPDGSVDWPVLETQIKYMLVEKK